MSRSNKDAWLRPGAGDLRTKEVVVDFPNPGDTVLVRALPARFSARVSSQFEIVQEGNQQVSRIAVDKMETLQFAHGVVEPEFTEEEARQIAENFGPVFRKVIAVIDELSGVDKEAVKAAEERFPNSGNGSKGSAVADSGSTGSTGRSDKPTVPARPGA